MVGEIRDAETAELGVHAALTGHLVLSTLHTNSASGALPRLLDMHIEGFLLASTLNAVLAQRLIRRICVDCKEEIDVPGEVKDQLIEVLNEIESNKVLMLKDSEVAKSVKAIDKNKLKLYKGKGCSKCGNTGYRGRIGMFELLTMSDEIARAILENSPASTIDQISREQGMISLTQDGYLRVLEGHTTLEEVMRVSD
jgi:type IV pilus assembly protein PilB